MVKEKVYGRYVGERVESGHLQAELGHVGRGEGKRREERGEPGAATRRLKVQMGRDR